MKNLFEPSSVMEIKQRIESLEPSSERQWGVMTPAQMLAHCSGWFEQATGLNNPPRSFIGRIVGKMAKKSVLSDAPIRRNMPTEKSLMMRGDKDFGAEQRRLLGWVDRFSAGGPAGCTKHPHCFFGPMTPAEWAAMGYKHLDHHLNQFGV
ncbi:DinB family protein [Terriglobus albidus]|uniref:DinB family protein n=1 Tax=Terriglobus albidus TaxID=1592106 RepID=A0A5B9EEL5_9BACT|nr:DUF1569 domain-containing protein [Terriglobus albidus]QEE30588.1 DinB family protein [Terriglobus albidus]